MAGIKRKQFRRQLAPNPIKINSTRDVILYFAKVVEWDAPGWFLSRFVSFASGCSVVADRRKSNIWSKRSVGECVFRNGERKKHEAREIDLRDRLISSLARARFSRRSHCICMRVMFMQWGISLMRKSANARSSDVSRHTHLYYGIEMFNLKLRYIDVISMRKLDKLVIRTREQKNFRKKSVIYMLGPTWKLSEVVVTD